MTRRGRDEWTLERDEDGKPLQLTWTPESTEDVLADALPWLRDRLVMEIRAMHRGWSTDGRKVGRCASGSCQHRKIEQMIHRAEQALKRAAIAATMEGR